MPLFVLQHLGVEFAGQEQVGQNSRGLLLHGIHLGQQGGLLQELVKGRRLRRGLPESDRLWTLALYLRGHIVDLILNALVSKGDFLGLVFGEDNRLDWVDSILEDLVRCPDGGICMAGNLLL